MASVELVMLQSMVGDRFSLSPGDRVKDEETSANRLIEAGYARKPDKDEVKTERYKKLPLLRS